MTLNEKSCTPCEIGAPQLSQEEAEKMASQLEGWQVVDAAEKQVGSKEGLAIVREFTFKNFRTAQAFVNAVGEIAEEEKHHPDILFGWGYVLVYIQTHKIKGLHENDFILAAKINTIED